MQLGSQTVAQFLTSSLNACVGRARVQPTTDGMLIQQSLGQQSVLMAAPSSTDTSSMSLKATTSNQSLSIRHSLSSFGMPPRCPTCQRLSCEGLEGLILSTYCTTRLCRSLEVQVTKKPPCTWGCRTNILRSFVLPSSSLRFCCCTLS